jgi:2-polyprenyl-3-methyl-5-hydroxy-6-metoxy-1,4-benzoquinol methylase
MYQDCPAEPNRNDKPGWIPRPRSHILFRMTEQYPETADIETSSDGYAARFAGPVGDWMLGVQESIALGWIRESEPATALDVGGGHGQLAVPLARAGYPVTVLGSDPVCGKRIEAEVRAGTIKFQTGNVIALPFPDKSFDVVISVRLLPHCERWPELVKEMCRVARKSVIVDYPLESRLSSLLFRAKKKLEGNTRTWRSFSHAAVQSEFEKNGFRLKRRTGQFLLPMVLHRTLRCRAISTVLEGVCRNLGLTRRWGSPVLAEFAKR